jgi:hypothetical protein
MPDTTEPAPRRVRLAWFSAIAIGSALAVGAVAEGLRFLLLH